jgi:hypothetical protein
MGIKIARLLGILAISALLYLSWQPAVLVAAAPSTDKQLELPYDAYGGVIKSADQVDYYSFEATAGLEITVQLETESLGSNLAAALALYDKNGSLLAYNDGEWSGGTAEYSRNPILYIKFPETDTYYFAVASAANFNLDSASLGVATGFYRITLFRKFDGPIPADTDETNDTQETATHISLPFQSYNSNLLYLGDIDWFSFDAIKGEKINIDIDSLELASVEGRGIPVRTRVGIFDSTRQLVSAVDIGYDADDGFRGDPSLIFDAPDDGRYYIAVTPFADTDFSTIFYDSEFLKNPYVSGANGIIGFYRISVRDLQFSCIPQFAIGDFGNVSYKTRILLLNPSDKTASGSISLFQSDGSPFGVTFSLPGGLGNKFWFAIPPKGQLILDANVEGIASSGYATIISTMPISGSAIFSQYNSEGVLVTEAAVGASPLMEFLAFPLDVGGNYNTGLAVVNMSNATSASLYFRLVDTQGNLQETRDVSLSPGEQISLFAGGDGQLFPSLTDFRGSLQVFSDSPVSAIALRTSARTLTALPVIPMDEPFDSATLIFPDMVSGVTSGKNYRSTLILTNPGYFTISGTIQFTQADGSSMPLRIGSLASSRRNFQIPPQGTVFLEPSSGNSFSRGYATVTANHSLGGVLVYSQFDTATGDLETEAAVPASARSSHFLIPAEQMDGYSTGFAVVNPNESVVNLLYTLSPDSDPSAVLQNGPVPLAPGNQKAQFISGNYQIFDGFSGTGVLEVVSDQPVAAVAVRVTATTTTVLPVVPVP